MYSESLAARLEREIEELLPTGPFSGIFHKIENSNPVFDMTITSEDYGRTLGEIIAQSPLNERVEMSAIVAFMLQDDPQHDDMVVVMIRGLCPDLRHHLTDDAVAREFAHRLAHHATIVIKVVLSKFAPKR